MPDVLNVAHCAVVLIAVVAAASRGFAYESTGSLEELYRLELLARLRPGTSCRMFSSYDRTGGNNDGFSGQYSKLRVEDGDSVLAEMPGPGCIQRIWFTHSEHRVPGLLERKGEHIRIYVDGDPTPALDVPLADLFSGELPRFPKPLVGEAIGGFFCYVPIPYRDGCKVVVDGTAVRFYQITRNTTRCSTAPAAADIMRAPTSSRSACPARRSCPTGWRGTIVSPWTTS